MSEPVHVLDASALLAVLFDEPGAALVTELLPQARVSAVNFSEVVAKLQEQGASEDEIDASLREARIGVVAFSRAQAIEAGKLRATTRSAGLSLGDRACLALAMELNGIAITTDRAWAGLDIAVEIKVVRPVPDEIN